MSKCETCVYRSAARNFKIWKCDYIEITGHYRYCEPDDLCTAYIKGDRIKTPNIWQRDDQSICEILQLRDIKKIIDEFE